ncbi:Cd(II)/Pb(II)-responsive transcriptional regulator [Desulfovibrio sp. TomC]|uniref:Cd(II)/Pb(II)-responsive transcriptional regulator n=1 Tax=Desulfovibrio sp. TomC TaxID=1562888 RepID=UPI000575D14A|nr:Cd(II)/Pb(II)-responsive transcriptional regulator [Desulfovibrio sp. TomC]KHK03266.1 Transcriptional regulator, MerR family [Desulfovibrio sp. TomC]
MRIGELAKRSDCLPETVRYYEREGLLPKPDRSEGNYRLYAEGHLSRLLFIRNCRALEMSLGEIRALLAIKDGAGADCREVCALLEAHIGHVTERLTRLADLREQLVGLRDRCGGVTPVASCGILQGLTEPVPGGRVDASPAEGHVCLGDSGSLCGRGR